MPTRHGWVQGYNCQLAVSSDYLILAADLHNHPADYRSYTPMIDQASHATRAIRRATGRRSRIGTVLADAGYASTTNLTAPDRTGSSPSAPDTSSTPPPATTPPTTTRRRPPPPGSAWLTGCAPRPAPPATNAAPPSSNPSTPTSKTAAHSAASPAADSPPPAANTASPPPSPTCSDSTPTWQPTPHDQQPPPTAIH